MNDNNYDKSRLNDIVNSLIYDRTQADVDYALTLERENNFDKVEIGYVAEDLKGAYNASDRNRVGGAINYIAALTHMPGVSVKADWGTRDIVRASDNANTIASLNRLKQLLPYDGVDVPAHLDRLSYQKANALERMLFGMYGTYERMNGFFVGDGYASDFGDYWNDHL